MRAENRLRILGVLVAVILIVTARIYCSIRQSSNEKQIFNTLISGKVVKFNSYYGRSVEFHLENGFTLYFMPSTVNSGAIKVGDSIYKEINSFNYKVFRKNEDGRFVAIDEYDIRNVY